MEYFIIDNNGQQAGPFSTNQLIEKRISAETLVWAQGLADWTPAWKIEELRNVLDEIQKLPPVPPTTSPQQEKPHVETSNTEYVAPQQPAKEPKKKSNKTLWKVLAGLVIFIILIFAITNPSEDAHRQAVETEVNEVVEKATATSDNNFFSQGIRSIAKMMAGSFMDAAFAQFFEYHNYIVCSKGTVSFDGKSHTVSFGILGKVYTMNADDIVKALEKDNHLMIESSSSTSEENPMIDESSSSSDETAKSADEDNDDLSTKVQKKLEDKANQALDKAADKVSKKVEEKINQKLNEVATDSTKIEKFIDKLLELF